MKITSHHWRVLPVAKENVEQLLATVSSPNDQIWPKTDWPSMRLDGPLAPGARGGHGPIRYRVDEVSQDRLTFRFEQPDLLQGVHYLYVRQSGQGCEVGHVI